MTSMEFEPLHEAAELLEKANADLEPELLTANAARDALAEYARIERLASFGRTMLSRKIDDAVEVARMTGTSIGKAKETVETAKRLRDSDEVSSALKTGEISFEQATEIAKAEEVCPGSASELLQVAQDEAFHVLKEKARKVVLEAEQHRGLAERQRAARSARSYSDELGMVHVHLSLQPHVGVPIVARAEAEAARQYRAARKEDRQEPFERHLADAYAAMLSGSAGQGPFWPPRAGRPREPRGGNAGLDGRQGR
jgi:hypothetical protein